MGDDAEMVSAGAERSSGRNSRWHRVDSRDESGGGNGRGGEEGRKADGAGSGIAGIEEDADQKAAEMVLGTAGMPAAITVVGLREIGGFGESGDQYGKIGRLPDVKENAEEAAEVAKDAEGLVVGTTEEVAAAA